MKTEVSNSHTHIYFFHVYTENSNKYFFAFFVLPFFLICSASWLPQIEQVAALWQPPVDHLGSASSILVQLWQPPSCGRISGSSVGQPAVDHLTPKMSSTPW